MIRAIPILAGLGLALTLATAQASPEKSLYAASSKRAASESESMSAAPVAELPPSPPTPAMEDKFRKLQKEMKKKESAAKPGQAGQAAKAPENTPSEGIGMGSLVMQIVFGLGFVLLLAVVSIRGLKKMQGRLLSKSGKSGDIFEMLETCHLGANQRVVAMRMNDEVGILGVTPHGITLLTILKEPVEELRRARAGESNSAAFSDNLNKLLDRFKKPKKVSDLLDEGAA